MRFVYDQCMFYLIIVSDMTYYISYITIKFLHAVIWPTIIDKNKNKLRFFAYPSSK